MDSSETSNFYYYDGQNIPKSEIEDTVPVVPTKLTSVQQNLERKNGSHQNSSKPHFMLTLHWQHQESKLFDPQSNKQSTKDKFIVALHMFNAF